ncbi:hypothetical protein A2801_02360 [Candidatus Woesebacteria bacterium RIFCSPHIGHO2_01_FULL_41_10]|uniref:tRNA-guanine(15) transglycosylase-like domain-containing protein n=1 Tax=Candidatus Woesebacteria bacterium RIFCSPHIGHO2_01_FULL_41_10 TaxID=1802500 RepID=A0A1F7YRD5_9BACT|nr:MAG: hypothetical protein A2801_02360 [Candidatus Woesebacteria bacterium RIFCSPHIGHO2_01_FULL_41_10]
MKSIHTSHGKLALPAFFPDATRAVVRAVDSTDISQTKTPGVLVNTLHLLSEVGEPTIKAYGSVHKFMNWNGHSISDSGGFQVYSLAKAKGQKAAISNEGVTFTLEGKKFLLTPELSIAYQFTLGTDIMVVLDDFTAPEDTPEMALKTVERTLHWAKRSKEEYKKQLRHYRQSVSPKLIAVVQGGAFPEARLACIQGLLKIGFDGFGYGGWPISEDGTFDYKTAELIAKNTPSNYLLYGLGIGKPDDIVGCVKLGYTLFDCVLPTRDGRHGRLYVYNADSIEAIDVTQSGFYSYIALPKEKYRSTKEPVSNACDCYTCTNFSLGYLNHLFKIKDTLAYRLATIHNLRFYSILMENCSSLST